MIAGAKMACIKAWLDDRGKAYKRTGDVLRCGYTSDGGIRIEFSAGEYLMNGKAYGSQRSVINEVLNPYYGNTYKEM